MAKFIEQIISNKFYWHWWDNILSPYSNAHGDSAECSNIITVEHAQHTLLLSECNE